MSEYHVGCGAFGIYAGTLEPKNKSLWHNKYRRQKKQLRTEVMAMRLIDGDALKKRVKESTAILSVKVLAATLVNTAPTIDAVPVVRCKGCKHFHPCEEVDGETWLAGAPMESSTRTILIFARAEKGK